MWLNSVRRRCGKWVPTDKWASSCLVYYANNLFLSTRWPWANYFTLQLLTCLINLIWRKYYPLPKTEWGNIMISAWCLASAKYSPFYVETYRAGYRLKEINNSLSLVLFSCAVISHTLQPHGLQHARLLCPSSSPEACSNSCPLSRWCHPTTSSSVAPFSSCLQSFPAAGSFQMTQFFAQVAKVLDLQLQHQSLQWVFRTEFL